MIRILAVWVLLPTTAIVAGASASAARLKGDKQLLFKALDWGWQNDNSLLGVVKDLRDGDPNRRYKMGFHWLQVGYKGPGDLRPRELRGLGVAFSSDGIHWKVLNEPVTQATKDGQTHWLFDDRIGRWVMYGRMQHIAPEVKAKHASNPSFKYHWGRAVARAESRDFIKWEPEQGQLVFSTDVNDGPMDEIYSLKPFRYEGIYIGLVQVFHNNPGNVIGDIQLAVSRDGIKFERLSDRSPFIPVAGVGQWDRFWISQPGSDPIPIGDSIRFYYCGRNNRHNSPFIAGMKDNSTHSGSTECPRHFSPRDIGAEYDR
jgi:hypothetical protein